MEIYFILSFFMCALVVWPMVWCCYQHGHLVVHSMEELQDSLKEATPDTLFVFDVDHVLTMPSDPCFQMPTSVKHKTVGKPLWSSLSMAELHVFYTLGVMESEQILVEPAVATLLNTIKAQGHRTIALTALHNSSFEGRGTVPWRLKELKRLSIDFSNSFPGVEPFHLDHLESHLGSWPAYEKGVLFSNIVPDKGYVLEAFLEKIAYTPSQIVFIDDVVDNLQAVKEMALRWQIPCSTVHYLGAYQAETPEVASEIVLAKWKAIAERARHLLTTCG